MTPEVVTEIGRQAIETMLLISAPMLGISLVVGLLVSMFQAMTQINEATLTFVPKMAALFVALLLFGPCRQLFGDRDRIDLDLDHQRRARLARLAVAVAADGDRTGGAAHAGLLLGFGGCRRVQGKPVDRVALGQHPAPCLPRCDQQDADRPVAGGPVRQCCDLANGCPQNVTIL